MNEPLNGIIDIVEVVDEKGWSSWDVRVAHAEHHRHGGKLIANCPTLKLAELVLDGIAFVVLEDGITWDVEFEVHGGEN
jgi:hypothetical protein